MQTAIPQLQMTEVVPIVWASCFVLAAWNYQPLCHVHSPPCLIELPSCKFLCSKKECKNENMMKPWYKNSQSRFAIQDEGTAMPHPSSPLSWCYKTLHLIIWTNHKIIISYYYKLGGSCIFYTLYLVSLMWLVINSISWMDNNPQDCGPPGPKFIV